MRLSFPAILVWAILASALQTSCSKEQESVPASQARDETAPTNIEVLDSNLGKLMGQVLFDGERPTQAKLLVVKDVAVCGKDSHFDQRLTVAEGGGIKNAVVSIVDIQANKSMEAVAGGYVLDQTGCDYQPHVLLLPVNTPLIVLNNDGILHNVHTYSTQNRALNIAQPKFKKTMEVVFTEPEMVSVRCDIHGWMSGWIAVVDHPFHDITDGDGSFVIDNVPPGKYTLKCWQELLGEKTMAITVEQGQTTSVEFRYSQ